MPTCADIELKVFIFVAVIGKASAQKYSILFAGLSGLLGSIAFLPLAVIAAQRKQ